MWFRLQDGQSCARLNKSRESYSRKERFLLAFSCILPLRVDCRHFPEVWTSTPAKTVLIRSEQAPVEGIYRPAHSEYQYITVCTS